MVTFLEECGLRSTRITGSGSGDSKPRPDVLAGNSAKGLHLVFEAKYRKELPINLGNSVEGLIKFAYGFGAIPIVAVKVYRKGWRFYYPDELEKSKNGTPMVKKTYFEKERDIWKLLEKRNWCRRDDIV